MHMNDILALNYLKSIRKMSEDVYLNDKIEYNMKWSQLGNCLNIS